MHKVLAIYYWTWKSGTFLLYCILVFVYTNVFIREGSHFKIQVTHSIEVSIATRTAEDDIRPTYVVAVSPSRDMSHLPLLSPPLPAAAGGLRPDQHSLLRLSNMSCRKVLKMFNGRMETANRVPHIEELIDGS